MAMNENKAKIIEALKKSDDFFAIVVTDLDTVPLVKSMILQQNNGVLKETFVELLRQSDEFKLFVTICLMSVAEK